MSAETIVHGATCTWWDSIDKAEQQDGMPCCPKCRGVLYECAQAEWDEELGAHDRENPGYKVLMLWARSRCFASFRALRHAWATKKGRHG